MTMQLTSANNPIWQGHGQGMARAAKGMEIHPAIHLQLPGNIIDTRLLLSPAFLEAIRGLELSKAKKLLAQADLRNC